MSDDEFDPRQVEATKNLIKSGLSVAEAFAYGFDKQLGALQVAEVALDELVEAFGLFTMPDETTLSEETLDELEAALFRVLDQPNISEQTAFANMTYLWVLKHCLSLHDCKNDLPEASCFLSNEINRYRWLKEVAKNQLSEGTLPDRLSPFADYLRGSLPLENRGVPYLALSALIKVLHIRAVKEFGVVQE
jgi:hypothetical protein